ncbi:MAG: right-handed parallel beta-helix repeat-containing protein [Planctomycetes bacterium]|nr:right-handed parallel beta-helix repeat-containing protein [Planctomycetota bacterium]
MILHSRLIALILACGLIRMGSLRAETITVRPGPQVQFELQSRLIEANPGDILQLESGRYEFRGELNLVCRGVTIRGRGPDATILSFRDQQAGSDGLSVTGSGFLIEDLAVENTAGNAIKVMGASDVTFRRVRTEWTDGPKTSNGAYGIYPVQCSDVLIEDCVAIAAADAGIYVGQSERVIVRRCRVEQNVAGIEIENTRHADVYENIAENNTGGIMVFDLPGLPVTNGESTRVYRNRIRGNNHANFAPKGNMVADVPSGTGMMIMAANQVEVFDNDIVDHNTANILVVSFLITGRPPRDSKYDPYCEGIAIHDNRMARGGTRPSGKIGELVLPLVGGKFADIVTDGIEDSAKYVDGRLPETLSIRLAENGDASFLNFNLAKLTPTHILRGQYRFERDPNILAGRLPALPPIVLKSAVLATGINLAVAEYRSAPKTLDEWALFDGDPQHQNPAPGVLHYELNTALFSDDTVKHRFIRLPNGERMNYQPDGVLQFPVGTVIAKTFAMPYEKSVPGNPERLLETRIQVKRESGWYGYSYAWDRERATLALGGGLCDVAWTHSDGQERTNRYEIPNANQCFSCHTIGGRFTPLGPTAANLNRAVAVGSTSVNQLAHWQALGVLDGLPVAAEIPKLPQFDDPASGTVAERARAWLDVNCAHCHQPDGSARASGLDLRLQQSDPARFGVMKSPVAAGRGSGGRRFDITPGKPDESILMFRLESTQPGVRMPNLARNLVPIEGADLVRQWIQFMPAAETE